MSSQSDTEAFHERLKVYELWKQAYPRDSTPYHKLAYCGWTTDLDRKSLSLSLDFGAGAGHARAHGSNFGPWGLSLEAQSYLTWSLHSGRELRASYEFYYDQSNPAVAESPSGAWHMSVLTVSFRWARK